MAHIKLTAPCLLAVLALGAALAAPAGAAEPEWGHCVRLAKARGRYAEGNCQTVARRKVHEPGVKTRVPDHKGRYEWVPGISTGFSIAGGPAVLEGGEVFASDCEPGQGAACPEDLTVDEAQIECASESGSGRASGDKEVQDVAIELHDCSGLGARECESPGAGAGEIQLNQLSGELGYVQEASKEVGLLVAPAPTLGPEAPLAVVECSSGLEALDVTLAGDGVISSIGPLDVRTQLLGQVFTSQGPTLDAHNIPSSFEAGPEEALEMGFPTPAGDRPDGSSGALSSTSEDTLEVEAEIKA